MFSEWMLINAYDQTFVRPMLEEWEWQQRLTGHTLMLDKAEQDYPLARQSSCRSLCRYLRRSVSSLDLIRRTIHDAKGPSQSRICFPRRMDVACT